MWAIVITFRPSSIVRPSTFHILIFSSETTGPIATKLWWNGPWMAPICIIGIYRLKEKFHKKKPEYMLNYPFFLFLAWWPSWLEVGITGHNLVRGPSKDHSTKVWLQLAQWFLRRRLKCEMLTELKIEKRGSLTYIPVFFCEIFLSADIYRLCKLGIFW
jgi:hypothetical protein